MIRASLFYRSDSTAFSLDRDSIRLLVPEFHTPITTFHTVWRDVMHTRIEDSYSGIYAIGGKEEDYRKDIPAVEVIELFKPQIKFGLSKEAFIH